MTHLSQEKLLPISTDVKYSVSFLLWPQLFCSCTNLIISQQGREKNLFVQFVGQNKDRETTHWLSSWAKHHLLWGSKFNLFIQQRRIMTNKNKYKTIFHLHHYCFPGSCSLLTLLPSSLSSTVGLGNGANIAPHGIPLLHSHWRQS